MENNQSGIKKIKRIKEIKNIKKTTPLLLLPQSLPQPLADGRFLLKSIDYLFNLFESLRPGLLPHEGRNPC